VDEKPKTSEELLDEVEEQYLSEQAQAAYEFGPPQDERKEPEIHSSPQDLRDMAKTTAWQDIKRRLLYSLMSRRDILETNGDEQHYDPMNYIAFIANTQGELFQIRTMLEMPERLARQKQMEIEDAERTREYERRTAEGQNRR